MGLFDVDNDECTYLYTAWTAWNRWSIYRKIDDFALVTGGFSRKLIISLMKEIDCLADWDTPIDELANSEVYTKVRDITDRYIPLNILEADDGGRIEPN